jgi:hypothetical protein
MSERNCDIRVDSANAYTKKLDPSFTVVDEINCSVFTIFQNLSIWKQQ